MTTEHYDVIIIGTGAGGGTVAHKLAPSGQRILLLERGGYLPREPANWDSREVFINGRYLPGEVWYDKDGEAFKPHQQYFVGGNTKFYGAVLFRLRERDFGEVQHYGGLSPAWPISYQDLEPYYAEAEKLYLVHGQAGEDPAEPPRSGPFPHPQVSHEPRIQQLSDDFEKTGHRPFHLPVGVDLNESDPEAGRCVRCDRFDGFPCLTDGKADAHVRCVRPALKHHNVTLVTHAKAERLVADSRGRAVTEVVVDRRGARETYSGDIVVVPCGAVNSAALLLKSANDQHPNGLANASDVVGRHYMAHINSGVIAISQAPNLTKFQRRWESTTITGVRPTLSCRSGTFRCSASPTGISSGAVLRGSRPVSRWTTSPSMPSTSGSRPRTCPTRRTGSRWTAWAASTWPRRTTTSSRIGACWPSSRH
jgi:choline dehydrogenase-like flavoprotein